MREDAPPLLVDLLERFAASTPDAPCLMFEGETITFAQMDTRAERVAAALAAAGVTRGERVALLAHAAPISYELLYGCAKAGAILTPVNWRLSPGEVAGVLADAEPRLVIADDALRALLAETSGEAPVLSTADYPRWRDAGRPLDVRPTSDPQAPLLLLYTSGTTGRPKGVVLTGRNLAYTGWMAHECWGFTADSVNLVAMPLFHIGGLGYGQMALSQGGATVLLPTLTPAGVLRAIEARRVTHGFFVPTVIQMLLDEPGVGAMDLSSLQRMLYGAAPIPEALLRRAIAVFGCRFGHAYGMTETAGTVVTLAPEDHDPDGPLRERLRAAGRPVPWAEVEVRAPGADAPSAVGEVGEVRVRSGMVTPGYWRKPEETAAAVTPDGWLLTGDAASVDADGYLHLRDRYKDMIVSGGENIYPTELENVLAGHPHVAEVAVVAAPHPRWGETPRAYVVLRDGGALTGEELIAFTRERLARYKCPTAVTFLAALPRNASGKVLKPELRARASAEAETP